MECGFHDQYVVVAGGFRGMGFALAKFLLSDGANVCLIGRSAESREKARSALAAFEGKVKFVEGDLSQSKTLNSVSCEVKEWCQGKLHHLVVFLGSGKTPFGYDFPSEHWKEVFDTNTFTPISVVQSFLPIMLHREGHPSITLTGAIAGVERVRAPMTYSIAKTALIAYSSHLASHLVDQGVRVNTISPGNVFFKGGRWEEILAQRASEIKEFLNRSVGMKRLGTAEELAWVYLSVMSPRNSFMTGQNIIADGLQINKIL